MRTPRLLAHAAICGLILSASVTGTPVALAQTVPQAVSNVSAISQDQGSLTIHKRLNPESYGTNPTGTLADVESAKGDPVQGVPFQVRKVTSFRLDGADVTADLTSNEGYAQANKWAMEFSKAANKAEFLAQNATLDDPGQTKRFCCGGRPF